MVHLDRASETAIRRVRFESVRFESVRLLTARRTIENFQGFVGGMAGSAVLLKPHTLMEKSLCSHKSTKST